MNETQDIIDSTQDGLMEATDEIVEMVGTATDEVMEHGSHDMPFYLDAHFWVAVAFVLVVVALVKPVGKMVGALMRKRIQSIADRIDEVVQLKGDAQKLLAEYERKFGNAENEAYQILERAKREIALVKREKLAQLENDLSRREKDAQNRIERASKKAVAEISALSTELAVATVKNAIKKKMTEKALDKLIEESISKLDKAG